MSEQVFVNRTLNMKKIKYIGLDMDHTLIRYKTENFESLVYQFVVEQLITHKNYPKAIGKLTFNFNDAIRGLVIDSKNGNILKLSRYGGIRQSYHGTMPIAFSEQKKIYRSTYVDLGDPNYMAIDTSFSIAFCVLYSQLVDFADKNDHALPNYNTLALDVLSAVDQVHAAGHLKKKISENLEEYVIQDARVVAGLKRYKHHGKKLFILTNSEYYYTKLLLDYAITPYLEPGEHWQDLFEYVITLSNKPRFFYDKIKFLSINTQNSTMTNTTGRITPGVYQGGNASQFTDDLALNGDEILYIGDHIYGDILRLKKDCNWRTALVVEELGGEVAAQKETAPIEQNIIDLMTIKKDLEHQYITIQTKYLEEKSEKQEPKLIHLHGELAAIDIKIANLLRTQQAFFNPIWDRMFRAGAEESYFAYQVERYACIYMEKIADLFAYSPLTYFRADRRRLPHD